MYSSALGQQVIPRSVDGVMTVIASYWLRANYSRNDGNVSNAWASSIPWMSSTCIKRAKKCRNLMGSLPLQWWRQSDIPIRLMNFLTPPVSLNLRSWVILHDHYKGYKNTFQWRLFDGVISFSPRCFGKCFLSRQLAILGCLIVPSFLVFLLYYQQLPSSSELELSDPYSVSESPRCSSLEVD